MAEPHDHHAACGCGASACAACRVPASPRAPLPTVDPTAWEVRRRRTVRRAAAVRVADRGSRKRVSVLMLDVGGVVIPSLFESVTLAGFPAGPLASEPAWARVQRGETTERAYWDAVAAERPGLDVGQLWKDCSVVRDELRGAIDALAGRVRLVAFTNDMAHFFGADWPARVPELQAFDAIVEAHQLGVHKPDPDAFCAAAAAVGERPDRCLFVDDLAVNLDGARRAGMHARLFDVRDPAGSMAALLADLDVVPGEVLRTPPAFRSAPAAPTVRTSFATAPGRPAGSPSTFHRGGR
jgi:FMN phosphatase YigB (HAD superfamily)